MSNVVFGKAMTHMLGPPNRQSVKETTGATRPRTYHVPDAETWQKALDGWLGIKG